MKKPITCSALALLCGTLSAPLVMAQAPAPKPAIETQQSSNDVNDASKSEQRYDATIAKLGESIKLTSEQKGKIKSVMNTDQADISATWAKFASDHVRMISMEAEMVAAMDDILEPNQQQKVEAKRQENEQAATAKSSANFSASTDKKSQQTADSSRTKGDASNAKTQPNDEAAANGNTVTNAKTSAADTNRDGTADADETVVWTMVIVPAQEEYSECEMSDAQKIKCDEVCQSYHKELVQLHQEIRSLHEQLVRLEAKEINEIENTLTSEQVKQLRTARKQAVPAKLTATTAPNTKR